MKQGVKRSGYIYPLTVIRTRYGGAYEGSPYAAFALYYDDVPSEAQEDDLTCGDWWRQNVDEWYVAVGRTPVKAIEKLTEKILRGED